MASNRTQSFGPTRLTKKPDSVACYSSAYIRMAYRWDPIIDLLSKTSGMRAARTKWLPQEAKETTSSYEVRLSRSYLFEALDDTIKKASAKPFQKPVTITGGVLPSDLGNLLENVDLCGTDFTSFAAETFKNGTTYGLEMCLVDYPSVEGGMNLQQIRGQGIRPYFNQIDPKNLIGHRSMKLPSGEEVLTEIRILGTKTESDGPYGDKEVRKVTLISGPARGFDGEVLEGESAVLGSYRVFVEQETKGQGGPEFVEDPSLGGTHTFPGVPLVVEYFQKEGFMEAAPPLESLAWKNIEHWQKASDHNHILRFSRFGILFAAGFEQEEAEDGIEIGPSRLVTSTSAEASLTYVDSSGSVGAMRVGTDDMRAIEDQMEVLGMAPFLKTTAHTRATGQMINKGSGEAPILSWIGRHKNFLRRCLEMAGLWVNVTIPEKIGVVIFDDFRLETLGSEDAKLVDDARARRDLDHQTYIEEMQRRGIISDHLDPQVIMDRLELENPGVGVGGLGTNDDETDEDDNDDGRDAAGRTGITDDHSHAIDGDSTNEVNGHTHSIQEGAQETGLADGHTHSL